MPQTTNDVTIGYACPRCGRKAEAEYSQGERCYGDLPRCANKCAVPFAVLDAIADWLDQRVADGAGTSTRPSRADLCGWTEAQR